MIRYSRPVLAGIRFALFPALLAIAAGPVQAQIDEIVVTSRRIEESLNDVPLSITAFTSEEIESAFIRNLDDVANLTPGLSFFNAQGEFLPVPVIRGVAPTDIFGENNAAIFVDGVYVSGREGLNFSQLDVERIEVVKGPQSALYGRNAFSGAINYITKRPTDEFQAKAEAIAGNDGRLSAQGAVSGPIFGNTLTGRAALLYDDFDGTYNNSLGTDDIGGYNFLSAQFGLNWRPTDTLDIYTSVYVSQDEIDDAAQSAIAANCEERGDGRLQNVCGELPGIDGADIPKVPGAAGEERDLVRANLNIDWDQEFGTLSFLTGFSQTKQTALVDGNRGEGETLPFVYCTAPFPGIPGFCLNPSPYERLQTGLLQIEQEDKTREISQEIRFTSPQDRAFRYTAGAYYYDVEAKGGDGGVRASNQPLPADYAGFGPFLVGIPFPTSQIAVGGSNEVFGRWFTPGGDLDPLARTVAVNEENAWALFSGVDYDITEALTARVELRYTDVEKTNELATWDEEDLSQVEPINFQSGTVDFDIWTGRVGLDFDISDNWMVYGYVAKGEKAGGTTFFGASVIVNDEDECTATGGSNFDPGDLTCAIQRAVPFDTESIITYEVGAKGRTSDGRVGLNLALYLNDWEDIVLRQTTEFDPISGLPLDQPEAVNRNAADSKYFGFEIDTDIVITDNLTSRFSLAYADAKIDNAIQDTYETFPSFAPTGDVSGNALLRRAKWQATATLNYSRVITGDWEFYTRGDWTWQDKIFIGNDNQSFIPQRSIVNATLGVRSGKYTIELWARNLLNDDTPISAYRDVFFTNTDDFDLSDPPASSFSQFFPIRYSVSHPRLRTFGLTARVRFGGAAR